MVSATVLKIAVSILLMTGRCSFMTEERARYYAKALAESMGITFYAVRSHKGHFLVV